MSKRSRKELPYLILVLIFVLAVLFIGDIIYTTHCFGHDGIDRVAFYMQAGLDRRTLNRNGGDQLGDTFRELDPLLNIGDLKISQAENNIVMGYDSRSRLSAPIGFIDDDVLQNITLSDLRHVTENARLNKTLFHNWTQSFLFPGSGRILVLPQWVINGEKVCDNSTELLVLMPSVPESQLTREIIRQTWASPLYGMPWPRRKLSLNTKLVFLVGTATLGDYKKSVLMKEGEEYGDLVAADFVDSYRNLTLKMVTGLNWIRKFCSDVKFMLKCDMDTFINLPLLTRMLSVVHEKVHEFVIGHKHENPLPHVLRSGKWEIPKEDYPFSFFPPYVIGHSYVISGSVIPKMVSLARRLPLIPAEDAFITGVLARIVRAPRLHYSGFADLKKNCSPCKILYNVDVSMTKMTVGRLLLMWRYILLNKCLDGEIPIRHNLLTNAQKLLQMQMQLEDGQQPHQLLAQPNPAQKKEGQELLKQGQDMHQPQQDQQQEQKQQQMHQPQQQEQQPIQEQREEQPQEQQAQRNQQQQQQQQDEQNQQQHEEHSVQQQQQKQKQKQGEQEQEQQLQKQHQEELQQEQQQQSQQEQQQEGQ